MQDHTMQHKKKMPAFRCLVIIIDSNIRDKLTEFLTDASIPIYYQMHGVGTVSSDFLNLCGLGDTNKTIMLCIVPKERTRMLLAEMNQALQLHKRGTGIAVSIPLSGIQGWLYKVLGSGSLDSSEPEIEKEVKKMSETITHAMILVTINQGYSDDVMYTEEVAKHFGMALQEEQEVLAIVVPKDKKTEIMTAISKQHGIDTPAHGISFALPVDAIMGL